MDVLASDYREQAVIALRDATVEGRLTLEEFSERVGHAELAGTSTDLEQAGHRPGHGRAPAADSHLGRRRHPARQRGRLSPRGE